MNLLLENLWHIRKQYHNFLQVNTALVKQWENFGEIPRDEILFVVIDFFCPAALIDKFNNSWRTSGGAW